MVVVDECDTIREEVAPDGAIGIGTAYRIGAPAPDRTMEFRKRTLHPGGAIAPHPIAHDEVCYIPAGAGEASSGHIREPLRPGMAACPYTGDAAGLRQTGTDALTLIVACPPSRPAQLPGWIYGTRANSSRSQRRGSSSTRDRVSKIIVDRVLRS